MAEEIFATRGFTRWHSKLCREAATSRDRGASCPPRWSTAERSRRRLQHLSRGVLAGGGRFWLEDALGRLQAGVARPPLGNPRHYRLGDHPRSEERRVGKECRSRWSP